MNKKQTTIKIMKTTFKVIKFITKWFIVKPTIVISKAIGNELRDAGQRIRENDRRRLERNERITNAYYEEQARMEARGSRNPHRMNPYQSHFRF